MEPNRPAIPSEGEHPTRNAEQRPYGLNSQEAREYRRAGYGLPCAQCKAYYPADLNVCPYCRCAERVSPATPAEVRSATLLREQIPSSGVEEAEILPGADDDEPLFAQPTEAPHDGVYIPPPMSRCEVGEHAESMAPASVCRHCYQQSREKADQLEAALSMDAREAAQVIYDAVWADPAPQDPSKTYQNAAQALLNELRRRAGLPLFMSPMRTYTH